jgi:hypothetical protein
MSAPTTTMSNPPTPRVPLTPSSIVPLPKPTFSSYLTKLGSQIKNWKRRYFALNEQGILEYFEKDNKKVNKTITK